jgi:NAD(P)-dependent dehydrogenase (short-subunit alcohol dehydrogenase family)
MATWLITGCSTGLGRAIAQAVLSHGHNAVVTARSVTTVEDIAAAYPDTALPLALDVTDREQISSVVKQAQARFGGIDVLVNNAGYGYRAAVEEADDADIRQLFDTNFFGAVSMIKAVLPGMRANRGGSILNISSIGARISPAGSGYYSATKAALEGLSGSLHKELQPLGISVTVIEPGAFRTDFAGRSLTQSATAIEDYAETAGKRRKENDTMHGTQPGDPAKAAEAILAVAESPNPPSLLVLGNDAFDLFAAVAQAERTDLDQWRDVSLSTGIGGDHP